MSHFSFRVTVGDAVEEFELRAGETKAISGLTPGAAYIVLETEAHSYVPHYYHESGTITGGGDTAVVVNVPRDEGALVISKTVNGGGSTAVAHYTKTYSASVTPSGGGSGNHLNTDDHYSYIIGYKDGTLQPYSTITRGEVATIFFRMLTEETREKYWSQNSGYSDCGPDLWCNNAISILTNMGIIDGYQDGAFRPYGKITRAQACVIVNRAMDRKPQKDRLLPRSQMVTWPDCQPGDWFYADMQEATNSHDYKWLADGTNKKYLEEWTKKLPQRDWAAFEHAWATAHSAPGGEVVK